MICLILVLEHEQLIESSWHDTWSLRRSLNSVSFSRTCLSVSEHTNIEAIDGRLHEHLCVFKNLFLLNAITEARVKRVYFLFINAVPGAWT